MSFISVFVHVVFTTKHKRPYLHDSIRKLVFNHILENAIKKEIKIIALNGYTDHVHCLLSLGSERSLGEVVGLIKGESSHWINQTKLINERFSWQKDYWAESINRDQIPLVVQYLNNQEIHHSPQSLDKKLIEFFNT